MGITQSDEFCEVYEQFMEHYDDGMSVGEITASILRNYLDEFHDDDPVMHNVYFALAKAEWMCGCQSADVLDRVRRIILSGADLDFYRELDASESEIKTRKKNLDKFLSSLESPRATPRKRSPKPQFISAEPHKGMVFWYKCKGSIYGGLVLDVVGHDGLLVALTELLSRPPMCTDDVLDAAVYTTAWFNSLLPPKRVHYVGDVVVSGEYNGRAGFYRTELVYFCENFGTDRFWFHEKRVLAFPGRKIRDLMNLENVPADFREEERLRLLLKGDRSVMWVSCG